MPLMCCGRRQFLVWESSAHIVDLRFGTKPMEISLPPTIALKVSSNAVAELRTAIAEFEGWVGSLPRESVFVSSKTVVLPRAAVLPRGALRAEVLAEGLYDLHSMLAGLCLVEAWRTAELVDGLVAALSSWNVTMAATAARALVETACAWFLESAECEATWGSLKATQPKTIPDLMTIRATIRDSANQMAWGTRLPDWLTLGPELQRTNILTLMAKTSKALKLEWLLPHYAVLCDTVHPSLGRAHRFWSGFATLREASAIRVQLSRDAAWPSDERTDQPGQAGAHVSSIVLSSPAWAVRRLLEDLTRFELMCRDICLTGRVYLRSDLDYWGIVRPTSSYEDCACGSGQKTKWCHHEFGPTH